MTAAPAQGLDRHPQILLEADRVGDMPAVHAKALLGAIDAVWPNHLVETGIGRGKLLILLGLFVFKVVRAALLDLERRILASTTCGG